MAEVLKTSELIERLQKMPPDAPVCATAEVDDGSGNSCLCWPGSVEWDGFYVVIEDAYMQGRDPLTPEQIAASFHESYERLAPRFGYETRPESAVPFDQVPEENRKLMIEVAAELLRCGVIRG